LRTGGYPDPMPSGIRKGIDRKVGWLRSLQSHEKPGWISGRFAYVSVSRASHDAQIYTNDAAALAENLSRDVSKASALEFGKIQHQVASARSEQTKVSNAASALGLVLLH